MSPPDDDLGDNCTDVPRLVQAAELGNAVKVSRSGVPVAGVEALRGPTSRRGRGSLEGRLILGQDWDSEAVNDAIAADFYPDSAE